jgi:hypothetical protein
VIDLNVRLKSTSIVWLFAFAEDFGLARCEALIIVHTHLWLRDGLVGYLHGDWHLGS